jgi:glycosyltransferase involved in cell wall biosynthesis|tara:strand:- start:2625 stop:3740 length:1116 start_codon:yes stop_codon:yes gene_type:complete
MKKKLIKNKLVLFMPSLEGGGVEKNFFLLSNFLIKKLDNVVVITISKKYKYKFNKKISFVTPKYFFWDSFGRVIKYIISLYLLFIEYLKDKKLTVFCFQGNVLCIIFCKIFNIKIIIRPNSSPSGWSQNPLKQFIFTHTLKQADRIIVNSFKFKNELKKKLNIKSECIYNPLNYKQIKELSKKKIKESSSRKSSLKIINVGRLVDQKDQITILKAINYIKHKVRVSLLIIGEGNKKNKLAEYIKMNNLDKIVKIKNHTKNPFPYIKSADIFVLSSLFEGLPNVLLEAITLNCFVISTNCPTGPSEILDMGKGGLLFKTSDYKDLSSKILNFVSNNKKNKNKIKFAHKRLDRFDYNLNLKKYFDTISNLMKF